MRAGVGRLVEEAGVDRVPGRGLEEVRAGGGVGEGCFGAVRRVGDGHVGPDGGGERVGHGGGGVGGFAAGEGVGVDVFGGADGRGRADEEVGDCEVEVGVPLGKVDSQGDHTGVGAGRGDGARGADGPGGGQRGVVE